MSELFMECEEEELEPWQRPAPQQVLIEDDDDEPIFVGVVSKNEKAVPPISPPPSKNNVEKQVANSAPSPASTLASSSIMLPLKIAGNAISTSSSGFTTLTPQPVIVNDQGLIVTQQLTSNNLIATLGNQYPPGTKFALVTAGQPQQLIQRFAQVTTAVPGVVHRPHVQQIRNNVVTLANVQNPTVYTAKPRLLQVNQATSLQTIALPGQATSLNKETLKRVLPVQQIDTAAKRFKDDVGQANVTNSLENGDIKKNCPNCEEEFLQQEALDCHMTSCQSKVEGNALLANNIVTHKRIMLVSEFYYGRFEGDPLMASPQRSSVTFKCQSCCKVLKSNIKFMNHMKHHLELEKQNNESWESHITCQHCYRQYTTPFHLQCHIESAHSPIESSTNCKICELAFESEQVLLEHMKDNHKPGEMPYVCQVCNYRSSFFSDVETHFRSAHVNTKDLLCPFCLRILRNGQCYMHHFMKHQKKGIHRCGKCRLNFLTYKDRIDHRAQVHKTFRKPSVLEGLPAGTKVTIRASLSAKTVAMSSSVDRSAVVLTPETLSNSAKIKPGGLAKSKRNISEAVKPKTVLKNKGNSDTNCNLSLKSMSVNGGCYTCIECNTKIDDFSSHFLLSSDCGACNYRTSCKVAIGNHMIRFHSTVNKSRFSKVDQRKHSSAMKLTLMCLNCDLLVDASGGDMMSKHLNDRTNHICKVIEEKGVKAETGVQDYSEAVRMKRKEILPKLKEARETGDIACQRHDKPIIVNQTAHQNNADTSDHSSKSLTILKSSPTETTIEPVQIEKIEHLPHAKVEQLQPLPVLPAAPEDSVGESAMQSVSSAVEDSPSKNVMQSVSSAVEDTPSKNVMQAGSSAVEDTPSKNVMQAGSSSCELDGVEDVEPIGDLNITENCQPDQISD